MATNIETKVREYLVQTFFAGREEEFGPDTVLVSSGIINSISAVQLVEFLEDTFDIEFEAQEVDQENLDSLNIIVKFVSSKLD